MIKLLGTVTLLAILAGVGWGLAHPRWAREQLNELEQYAGEIKERVCKQAKRPGYRIDVPPELVLHKDVENQKHLRRMTSRRDPPASRPDAAVQALEQKRVAEEIASRRSSRIRMLTQVLEEKAEEQADDQQ